MKKLIAKKTTEEMLAHYDEISRNEGWFLRIREVANGGWEVEAADVFGRKICRSGNSPGELVNRIEKEIQADFPAIGNKG